MNVDESFVSSREFATKNGIDIGSEVRATYVTPTTLVDGEEVEVHNANTGKVIVGVVTKLSDRTYGMSIKQSDGRITAVSVATWNIKLERVPNSRDTLRWLGISVGSLVFCKKRGVDYVWRTGCVNEVFPDLPLFVLMTGDGKITLDVRNWDITLDRYQNDDFLPLAGEWTMDDWYTALSEMDDAETYTGVLHPDDLTEGTHGLSNRVVHKLKQYSQPEEPPKNKEEKEMD